MLRSPLLPIFLTVFVDVLGMTLVLPLLPFYAEHFGATPLVVGLLAASYAVCQLVSGPILGRISDRVGRKPTLLASQVGTFIGFLVLGSANALWVLFLGRIIDGLTAGNLTIAQAYISDVTRPEERTRAFGLIGIAFGGGFLLGPAISGFLAHRFGYASPAYGAAALSLTSILLTAAVLPANPRAPAASPGAPATASARPAPIGRGNAFRRFFDRPLPRRRLLEFFAFSLSFSTLIGGLALFLERRFEFDVEKTGYLYAFSGLIGGSIQGGLIGRLARRYGEERLALLGFAAMVAGYGLLGVAYNLPTLLLLVAVAAFGAAVVRPSITTLLTKSVGRDEQGAALGVSQSLASISQIVGPIGAGWLIEHRALAAYGLMAATFAACGIFLGLQKIPAGEPVES
ncbi:tetracycline resistance MFS efflux pump [Sorangium cellulosum]|uniref:Tetracycline resistance MFS efflux pump n=1 Tax=Sorangium cellulosum TaxID=56 RepID=A0A2L0F2G1_SORCE|nr:MFS transporter [Sorangium cellulosum]AUX45649.1 tetracycline resistance MFS efflux pump [Sorangium cellulosum]